MELKEEIYAKARSYGARLVRTAEAASWENEPIQAPEFWPRSFWPWCTRVVVLGIPLFMPMIGSTPSMVYKELYDTSNRLMDEMAYRLAADLMDKGFRAAFFPRDCYDGIPVLLDKPSAAFSHVTAGYYAGLGTFGDSHNLLTKEYGPRVRLVSVLTDAPIEPDRKMSKELCIHCKLCLKSCPSRCFAEKDKGLYEMDKRACTEYHLKLIKEHRFPCGICAAVCPVGEDRKLFRGVEPVTKEGASHLRSYGS